MIQLHKEQAAENLGLSTADLIDRQAKRTPDAFAARDGRRLLTYADLIDRADRLAAVLMKAGVGPEIVVGLCTDRSVDMIVGVLGIFKAGGAFLPLDPAYPSDRLAIMLEDSGARFIVAKAEAVQALPAHSATVIDFDDAVRSTPGSFQPIAIASESLAYVVYTSGSTGRPKGVMIEHGSLAAFLEWTGRRFSAAQMANVLCSSSLSFDVAYFEIFAPLAVGGCVVIVRDALELITAPPAIPVTTMSTVASALSELVRAGAIPPTVTTILQAGEYLPASLARAVYDTTNVTEFINLCGGTEDTIYSVSYLIPRDVHEDPPIGRAFFGHACYILDAEQKPVAPGTPGEIYYGGLGVARGYINRPDLTAQRFLSNPFGDSPTMYRSGDIVVEGSDGEIRYLRRDDQQVKVRGYRIELAEVEAALRDHPAIDQIVVLAREIGGHKTLTAYAVERPGSGLDYGEFLKYAADRLPEFMVPSTLVLVDSMPVGPSGKLDREALQSLERRRPELAQNYIAPRNDYETKVADLCCGLLGLDRVGVYDNFFALGGQSLLATRLVGDIEAAFPEEVRKLDAVYGNNALLAAFYVEPTIESLAAALAAADSDAPISIDDRDPHDPVRRIQAGNPGVTPFFLLHGVLDGEAFYCWNLAQGIGSDIPFYAIAPHGASGTAIPITIEAMADDYLKRIRDIAPSGPYRLGGYCNGGLVALEIARRLTAEGETVESLIVISASAANVKFRGLRRSIEKLGAKLRLSEAARRTMFLKTRGRVIAVQKAFHRGGALDGENLAPEIEVTGKTRNQDMRRHLAFLRAIDAYVPDPYAGPVRYLWGRSDPYGSPDDPYNGWRKVSPAVEIRLVDGGHTFLEDHPERVVAHIRDAARGEVGQQTVDAR